MPSLIEGGKPHAYDFSGAGGANTQTLSSNLTLVDTNGALEYLDANGANRDVTLPAVSTANHPFVIVNTASGAYSLIVKNAGGTTIVTVLQNQIGLVWSNGVSWRGATNASVIAGASSTNYLTGDVTMTTGGTFYDGPSLSLIAGTWLLMGTVTMFSESIQRGKYTARLYSDTTVLSSTEDEVGAQQSAGVPPASTYAISLSLQGVTTLISTKTCKISVTCDQNGGAIKATTPDSGTANTASYLIALRIG